MRVLLALLLVSCPAIALAQGPPSSGDDAVEPPPPDDEYNEDWSEDQGEAPPDEQPEEEPIDEFELEGEVCTAAPCPLPSERLWGGADLTPPLPRSLNEVWAEGEPRLFVSSSIDVGFLYLRPRFALGWGKPHASWLGVEANPIIAGVGAGGYGGLRAQIPEIGFRIGARYFYSWYRSLLIPGDYYDRQSIELHIDAAQYVSLEAEASTATRLGPGVLSTEVAATAVVGLPEDRWVFEETIRVIVAPPWVFRGRISYGFETGPDDMLRIGPAVDVIWVPGRPSWTVRLGLIVRVRVFEDLEVRGTFVPTLSSPDNLGLAGGDFGLLGVRWNWASR